MDRTLITLVFLIIYANCHSQDNYKKLPFVKSNCPMIIVNKDIIANESTVGASKESIEEISILKDKPNPKEHKFYNLTEHGILFISLKKRIPYKKQSQLNDLFGIAKNNGIYVNGYLIESSDYKIATKSILEIELIGPSSENKLKRKAINVWTLTKEERTNGCPQQNSN
ncbi:hypothetical protein [Aquimarina litoralis]|uniref:hypothetical protein n=1 Tax=Aquimarina litoralis TaxID=584605 RepID=UPI001C561EAD|nr:hypothetical protein [Aquimarina litoralis]MBW1296288.1 hypothetical protein [Aquimarina litoralis]